MIVYITGPTGSGKSTICEALRTKGYESYDSDDEGMRSLQKVDGKEILSLNPEVVRGLHRRSANSLMFLCGTSPSDLNSQELFTKIILLVIDESEQKRRILQRTSNDYGKQPQQLANAIMWRQLQIDKYKSINAVDVNTNQPIDDIVSQILHIAQSA